MNDILIIEDEKSISNLIRLSLSKAGYKCTCVFDGVTAADLLENNRYDLVLLDIMLPGFDGFTLMEYIRPMEIPVIFITAKGSVEDRIKGLRAGAEDYIVKPFDIAELLARIEVVLRRYNKLDSLINIGSVTIDLYSRSVKKDGEEIHLTPKEYDLLLLFIRIQIGQCIVKQFTKGYGAKNFYTAAKLLICIFSVFVKSWVGNSIFRQ